MNYETDESEDGMLEIIPYRTHFNILAINDDTYDYSSY